MSPNADDRQRQIDEATAYCRRSISQPTARWAIVLGSGMSEVAQSIDRQCVLPYGDIPHFRDVAVAGHSGELIFGTLGGIPVVVMSGRYHFYEGHPVESMTLPIAVLQRLGVDSLVVSNAAGGVNPRLCVGDLMVIDDLVCTWQGFGLGFGRRWGHTVTQDSGATISHEAAVLGSDRRGTLLDHSLNQRCRQVACELGFTMPVGCYLATTGPTYETRAEYRMMRRLGVDVVGMSTAAEVVYASVVCQMRVLAISMVSNVANVDRPQQTSHDEVVRAGEVAAGRMRSLVTEVVRE